MVSVDDAYKENQVVGAMMVGDVSSTARLDLWMSMLYNDDTVRS